MTVKKTKKAKKELYDKINNLHKKNDRAINVRFNLVKDSDILELLDSMPNKAEYLRQLIRYDITNNIVKKDEITNPTFTNVKDD